MKRAFEPLMGFISSIGIKGATDLQEVTSGLTPDPSIINYFYIGILGAIGGLLVKITWGCMKMAFPKLKKIENHE